MDRAAAVEPRDGAESSSQPRPSSLASAQLASHDLPIAQAQEQPLEPAAGTVTTAQTASASNDERGRGLTTEPPHSRPSIIVLSPRQSPTPSPPPPSSVNPPRRARPLNLSWLNPAPDAQPLLRTPLPPSPPSPRFSPSYTSSNLTEDVSQLPEPVIDSQDVEALVSAGTAATARRRPRQQQQQQLEQSPPRPPTNFQWTTTGAAAASGRITWREFLSETLDEAQTRDQPDRQALYGRQRVPPFASSLEAQDQDWNWNSELGLSENAGLAQEEGAVDDPLWRAGTEFWLNEPVDVERRDRIPRGGSRLADADSADQPSAFNSHNDDEQQLFVNDPRSPPPRTQLRRINIREAFRSGAGASDDNVDSDSRVTLRYGRIFPSSLNSNNASGVGGVRDDLPRSRYRNTTRPLMGRTMRMKKDCFLLYCGGQSGLAPGGGGAVARADGLPPGWHWQAGTSTTTRQQTPTTGCGKLICSRGYAGHPKAIDPSLMTPHNWLERSRDKFYASDVPVRAEDVSDVAMDDEQEYDEMVESERGFCRRCKKAEIGCRDCGNILGYRILRFCQPCQETNPVELDGLLWRFWQHAVTSRHRLVGIDPTRHVDDAVQDVEVVEEVKTNVQSDSQERIEPKMPVRGAKMRWGQLPHPQIDYENGLVGEPRDWLNGGNDNDDSWWLSHSVNIHCQERLSRVDNLVLSHSNDQDDNNNENGSVTARDRLPVFVERRLDGTNDEQRTPDRFNNRTDVMGSDDSGGSSSLRRSGAIRAASRRLFRRLIRSQDEEDENDDERDARADDESSRDGRRVRARLDEAGTYSLRNAVSQDLDEVEVGYGARHVGRTDRVARMRRLSSMTFMTGLDAVRSARAGR
ncbi:hypothetical protein ACM66B_006626 [Microbotryomycetes sp. NB124-2]